MKGRDRFNKKQLKVTFDDGDEIVTGIKKALEENKVERATVNAVSGSLSDVDLTYYIGGIKRSKHMDGKFKMMLMQGTLIERGNMGYKGNVFVSLADGNGFEVIGGDLIKAKSAGESTVTVSIEAMKEGKRLNQ